MRNIKRLVISCKDFRFSCMALYSTRLKLSDLTGVNITRSRASFRAYFSSNSMLMHTPIHNPILPVGRHFASPGHASTDMLVSVIHSGFRDTQDRRLFEARMFSNTKLYIREDLIPTLPFYKLPKSVQFE